MSSTFQLPPIDLETLPGAVKDYILGRAATENKTPKEIMLEIFDKASTPPKTPELAKAS